MCLTNWQGWPAWSLFTRLLRSLWENLKRVYWTWWAYGLERVTMYALYIGFFPCVLIIIIFMVIPGLLQIGFLVQILKKMTNNLIWTESKLRKRPLGSRWHEWLCQFYQGPEHTGHIVYNMACFQDAHFSKGSGLDNFS